jgi:transcriptional regulator with XRE-family HTH domain
MGHRLGTSAGRQATEALIDEQMSHLITQVTNETDWFMRERNLTRADLAARMGVSPGRVSQVLSGGENLTLRTLASLAAALDAQFEVELKPRALVPDPPTPIPDPMAAGQPAAEAYSPLPQAGGFSAQPSRFFSPR